MKNTIYKVCSGGVIYHDGKVLTIKWLSRNTIEFPKGTMEEGETKEATCIREVFEETGYKTKIIKSLGKVVFEFDHDDNHYNKTVHQYLLELASSNEPTPQREEHEDFEDLWLTLKEAAEQLTFNSDIEVLNRAEQSIKLAY